MKIIATHEDGAPSMVEIGGIQFARAAPGLEVERPAPAFQCKTCKETVSATMADQCWVCVRDHPEPPNYVLGIAPPTAIAIGEAGQ